MDKIDNNHEQVINTLNLLYANAVYSENLGYYRFTCNDTGYRGVFIPKNNKVIAEYSKIRASMNYVIYTNDIVKDNRIPSTNHGELWKNPVIHLINTNKTLEFSGLYKVRLLGERPKAANTSMDIKHGAIVLTEYTDKDKDKPSNNRDAAIILTNTGELLDRGHLEICVLNSSADSILGYKDESGRNWVIMKNEDCLSLEDYIQVLMKSEDYEAYTINKNGSITFDSKKLGKIKYNEYGLRPWAEKI